MSLVGIVNLTERLLNQANTQGQDVQATAPAANRQTTQAASRTAEDQFTPSAANGPVQGAAEEAGLFNVAQFSFFSAAADLLLGQNTGTTAANPAATALPATTNSANPNGGPPASAFPPPLTAANPGSAGNVAAANALPAAAPAAPAAPAANANGIASAAPQGALAVQQQLQTLNQSLVALGLTPQEIQELDRIASVINDFNPLAFTSLAFQLEQLAQLTAPQTPAPAGGNAPLSANNTGATQANATQANAGGFQVQELVIKFAGVQVQANAPVNGNANQTGAAQTAAGNGTAAIQFNAFNLQVEEVNLTLVNGNAQTVQIQAPVPAANQGTTNAHKEATTPKARTAVA